MSSTPSPSRAFYSIADERYFLGAVGLVNSLRLVGHTEPIYVLDCGLSERQRRLLGEEATIVPGGAGAHPLLRKTVAPLAHPAGVMVLIDADMIVTRRLDEPLASAAKGRLVAVEHGEERFFERWGELLGLGPVRRHRYFSGGLLLLGGSIGHEVLALMDRVQGRIDFERSLWRANDAGYEFLYGDQDVWNAIAAAALGGDALDVLDRRVEGVPPFSGLRVLDERTLRCAYDDGSEPLLLHHYSVKPWLELTLDGIYSRLLRRLLGGGDVAIRVRRGQLPVHMRGGLVAEGVRNRGNGHSRWRSYVVEPIATRLGPGDRR